MHRLRRRRQTRRDIEGPIEGAIEVALRPKGRERTGESSRRERKCFRGLGSAVGCSGVAPRGLSHIVRGRVMQVFNVRDRGGAGVMLISSAAQAVVFRDSTATRSVS